MAVVTEIGTVEGAGVVVSQGVTQEAIRVAKVSGLTAGESAPFNAVTADGMPLKGSAHPNDSTLLLEDYRVSMNGGTFATVDLVYRRQEFAIQPDEEGYQANFSGGTALETIQTQKDKNGDPITVTHNGVTQGGFINVTIPRSSLNVSAIDAQTEPGSISTAWVGKVNSANWNGGEPGTWMCTSVTFDAFDLSVAPPKWRFNFSFTHRAEGWNPDVVFIDPTTGKPPSGLVEGEGYKTIEYFETKDFGQTFPT